MPQFPDFMKINWKHSTLLFLIILVLLLVSNWLRFMVNFFLSYVVSVLVIEIFFVFLPTIIYGKFLRLNLLDFLKPKNNYFNFLLACSFFLGISIWLIREFITGPGFGHASSVFESLYIYNSKNSFYSIFLVIFSFAILPAFCEEFAERGFIQQGYINSWGYLASILLGGVIRVILHINKFSLVSIAGGFLSGIIGSFLYAISGTIICPIVYHFTGNALLIVSDYFAKSNFTISHLPTHLIWWGAICILIVSIVILYKIARDSNFIKIFLQNADKCQKEDVVFLLVILFAFTGLIKVISLHYLATQYSNEFMFWSMKGWNYSFDKTTGEIKPQANPDKTIYYLTKAITAWRPENNYHILSIDLNNRASAYMAKGLFNLALKDLNKAIDINPHLADVYFNRSRIYFNKEMYDKAISDLYKAISLSSQSPYIAYMYEGLAYVYATIGDKKNAIIYFRKAVELNPDYRKRWIHLVQVLNNKK